MHQQSDNSKLYVKFCQYSFGLPPLTPGINSITTTIIETTSKYSSPVTSTTTAAATALPPSAMETLF
ncbi:unnamed protein product [Schistocephalus solidus]|uniref:Uncharacterized protein n=1 Tax=Schistocephalus solidus TaxID=70667 RepID=A0A183T9U5_SCHSO|nr:unnamed protein product [Schistocephalus solidus]